MPAIVVEGLQRAFDEVLAVQGVDLEVDEGEIYGFLGPNGAGKTTTMRILTSYLPATSGVAKVAGHDVMNASMEVRQNIGYLPDTVPLYPEMRVEEYLGYRAKLKGVARKERQPRIDHVVEHFRIREVRRRLIGTLSHGYRQRVGLADALVHDPPILILDEPTGGLDPLQIRETLKTIRSLHGKHTILLSTHILSQVEDACDRVIIINRGRIGMDRKLSDLAQEAPVIVVEVRGPRDQVVKVLEATEGVESVKPLHHGDGIAGFEVAAKENQDLREAICERLVKNGWTLRRLELRRTKLEDRFAELVLREAEEAPTSEEADKNSTAIQPAKSDA